MSRQVSLLVNFGITVLGVLGWINNPILLAQPIPSSSFDQIQTSFSNSLSSSDNGSEEIEGKQIQEYGKPQRSNFNPILEQLEDKATDSSRFSPVNSVPEIFEQESEEKLNIHWESSLTVDYSLLPKKAIIRLHDTCSTQEIPDYNSFAPQNPEDQELVKTNNSCFAKPNLRASDLGFPQREEKLIAPEIFSQLFIAEENFSEGNSESDLDQSSNDNQTMESGNENGWRFKVQPYFPIPITVYGSATVGDQTVDYQLNLGEVLDVLEMFAPGRFEAWKGDLGFIVSAYYIKLGGSGIEELTRLPVIGGTLEEELKFRQGVYDFALSYYFGDQPSDKSFPIVWFEPMIGARLNDFNIAIDAKLNFGILGISSQDRVEIGRTWFEPLIGGKLGVKISDPFTLWARGNASGFGLAGETNMSWNFSFGGDWRVNRSVSLQLGYFFYQVDYKNGSGDNAFGFEQNQNGLYLSATFHF